MRENKSKISFKDPCIALLCGIIGGILFIVDFTFFKKTIVFKNPVINIHVIVITYAILFCLYKIKERKIKLVLFTFYYALYSMLIFSIINIILNSAIYFLKSETVNYYETELKFKKESTLRRRAKIVFLFNEIRCGIEVPRNKYISNASKIHIKYYNSILDAKVISEYNLY